MFDKLRTLHIGIAVASAANGEVSIEIGGRTCAGSEHIAEVLEALREFRSALITADEAIEPADSPAEREHVKARAKQAIADQLATEERELRSVLA